MKSGIITIAVLLPTAVLIPGVALGDTASEIAALQQAVADQQTNANHIWTMLAAALVLLMQFGFLLLEAGFVRAKNSVNVAQKNFVDLFIAVICFYVIGFGLMFGSSINGWLGNPLHFMFFNQLEAWDYTFFVFQAAFVGTAATIVSGAVAERMRFGGYIFATLAISLVIYPVFGHWAWGNLLDTSNTAWLANAGFIDFAGSTVVHSVGAWIGLAGIIVLGPRIGKFNADGSVNSIQGYSVVLAGGGALVLMVGWIGFNGGSTTAGTPAFAKIVANTILAAAFAGGSGLFFGYLFDRKYQPSRSINSMLGGLVAITAGCDAVMPGGAAQIGLIAGLVVILSAEILERYFKLDDVLYAVSIHGTCGVLGTLLVAVYATEEKLAAATRFEQFLVQAQGAGLAFVWSFGLGMLLFVLLDRTVGLRVSHEDEVMGLNAAEHGVTLGTGEIQKILHAMISEDKIDLTRELNENSGDEAAEIAQILNPFLRKVRDLAGSIQVRSDQIADRSSKLEVLSKSFLSGAGMVMTEADSTHAAASNVDTELKARSDMFGRLSENSEDVSQSARLMTDELGAVSQTVQVLSVSIKEIATNASSASAISNDVIRITSEATVTTSALQEAARQIQDIVALISNIANQTNLLALNATIEAARAGIHGRGFGIVAGEVKSLAQSTSAALEDIQHRIGNLVNGTNMVTGSITQVSDIVASMNDAIRAIAEAAEKQGISTGEISTSVNNVSSKAKMITGQLNALSSGIIDGSSEVRNITNFTDTLKSGSQKLRHEANSGLDNAHTVGDHVNELADIADHLKKTAGTFKISA